MKKKLIASLLAASMLLTLAACGGKNENPENSKTPADSTASTPAVTPESTGQDAQPETTPEDTANLAFTVTETGVYLYDGTFLATGETVKLNDAGASIDMQSVTIENGDNSDITYLFDGKSPIGAKTGTAGSPVGQYGKPLGTPTIVILNNTQDNLAKFEQCLGVYADFSINRDPSKGSAYSLNGELFGKGRETYPMARILEILGDPMGAYCTVNTCKDLNGNMVECPRSVVYFWKSGNFEESNLVLAFEIRYSGTYSSTTAQESDNSHLHVILTDHLDGIKVYDDYITNYVLPGMQELGLY